MTREGMLTILRSFSRPSMEDKEAIATRLQADGETIARLEVATLQQEGDLMAAAKESNVLSERRRMAEAERDAAISALTEEGSKRGKAEAIIAEMLRLDCDGSEEEWQAACSRARAAVLRGPDIAGVDARVAELEAALRPFAETTTPLNSLAPYRRARAALRPAKKEDAT